MTLSSSELSSRRETATMTPVTFANRAGLRLFGILHQPSAPVDRGLAVILLSPGVKMRVAPHRLYNKLAERWVAAGHTVLRFDFHGLGDAEGESPETKLADLYRATQLGRYVDDTVDAITWLQHEYGVESVIAAGLCGGALTGLLTAARDERICGLIGLSIPVILDGSGVDAAQFMTAAQLTATRYAYFERLQIWKPAVWRSWLRLLSLQSDYRMIVRSLVKPLAARIRRRSPAPAAAPAAAPLASGHTAAAVVPDNTNPLFAPAFLRMVSSRRRVQLIFAESDRLYWEYEAKFVERQRAAIAPHASWSEVHVVGKANHIFSFAEWQQEVLNLTGAYLDAVTAERSGR